LLFINKKIRRAYRWISCISFYFDICLITWYNRTWHCHTKTHYHCGLIIISDDSFVHFYMLWVCCHNYFWCKYKYSFYIS